MENLLGKRVMVTREKSGYSRSQLATAMGYKNINKGSRRIHEVERGNVPDEVFLRKLIDALGLDTEEVITDIRKMDAQAEEEFQAWLKVPVPMQIIMRVIPAVYFNCEIPEHVVTEEDAISYARELARERGFQICLVLSRRWSVWVSDHGKKWHKSETTRNSPNVPSMSLKGKRTKFLLGISKNGIKLVPSS